jgi:hypothetical protein
MTEEDWAPKVLEILREGWSLEKAAKAAGVTRMGITHRCKADPEFARLYAEAIESGTDTIEDAAFERGMAGGSDRMLELILKARRPERFTEKHQVSVTRIDPREIQAELERIMAQVIAEDAVEEPKRLTDESDRKD